MKWKFRQGGNPPIAAGIFIDDGHLKGNRVAWWPAGYEPNERNCLAVVNELVLKRETDDPVNRGEIRRFLDGIAASSRAC